MSIESILKTRMEKAEQCLTPASRRSASYLQENYSEVAAMTAMDLAAKTQTSPATVVRFCYSLGFDGFSDLKSFLDKNTREPCAGLYDFCLLYTSRRTYRPLYSPYLLLQRPH